MGRLLNQHQLAKHIGRTRVSIVRWRREGLPIAEEGGPGKETLYDPTAVVAWMKRTGRGLSPALAPLPQAGPPEASSAATSAVHTSAQPSITRPDMLLGRVLERAVLGLAALMIERGLSDEAALEAVDEVVVCFYDVLEEATGREAQIPVDGMLEFLRHENTRAALASHARYIATQLAGERDQTP